VAGTHRLRRAGVWLIHQLGATPRTKYGRALTNREHFTSVNGTCFIEALIPAYPLATPRHWLEMLASLRARLDYCPHLTMRAGSRAEQFIAA